MKIECKSMGKRFEVILRNGKDDRKFMTNCVELLDGGAIRFSDEAGNMCLASSPYFVREVKA